MAMNYTPIPNDFLEEMSELTDAEYGRLIRWCQTYITTGEQIELRGNEKYHLVRCRMQMDRYTSHYAEVSRKRSAAGKKGGEANASKCKQTEANGGKRKETKTKTETETNISPTTVGDIPPQSPPKGGTQEFEDAFEAFWALYPKKKSKGDARKAWKQIRPSRETVKAIMEKLPGLIASRDWQRDGGQYIPYPGTWLRREGWLDEVSTGTSRASDQASGSGNPFLDLLKGGAFDD